MAGSSGSRSKRSNEHMETELGPLVKITWVDSVKGGNDGPWSLKEDILDLTHDEIQSVGWIVRETDESITIVAHVSESEYSGEMCIPKSAVIKRKKLR